jgi:HSP20 family protein
MAGRKSVPKDEESVLQDDFLDLPMEEEETEEDWLPEADGQLAVDVYQTKDSVVVKAPIAGVRPEDIDVEVAEDMVTIRGERKEQKDINAGEYYIQECHWGAFSRSVILPASTVAEKAVADLTEDGILTVTIPKVILEKVKKIKVNRG